MSGKTLEINLGGIRYVQQQLLRWQQLLVDNHPGSAVLLRLRPQQQLWR